MKSLRIPGYVVALAIAGLIGIQAAHAQDTRSVWVTDEQCLATAIAKCVDVSIPPTIDLTKMRDLSIGNIDPTKTTLNLWVKYVRFDADRKGRVYFTYREHFNLPGVPQLREGPLGLEAPVNSNQGPIQPELPSTSTLAMCPTGYTYGANKCTRFLGQWSPTFRSVQESCEFSMRYRANIDKDMDPELKADCRRPVASLTEGSLKNVIDFMQTKYFESLTKVIENLKK